MPNMEVELKSSLRLGALTAGLFIGGASARAEVLLVPDSAGNTIWAFDPYDGAVLSDDYVPDDGRLIQPIHVVDSGYGTLLVSDENADSVFEYAVTGEFIRVLADGDDGLDALQGMAVRAGHVYVGSRTGRSIFKIRLSSGEVFVWASNVGTPRDLVFRKRDVLVTNSDPDADGGENIERFAFDGSFIETFHDSDGVTGIDFPQQLQREAGGGVLVAGFSPPRGLYHYDASGRQVAVRANLITSPRGVVRLGNGMILYAGGTRVMRYDPATGTEETVVNQSGTSFRYVERSSAAPPRRGDVNRDGRLNVGDLITLIYALGPCPGPACLSDLNEDEVVDVVDLIQLLWILRDQRSADAKWFISAPLTPSASWNVTPWPASGKDNKEAD